jgi:uncharacterized protein YlbG (UPF0298 family)
MPKFKIIENLTLRKKQRNFMHNPEDGNQLESQMVKLKQLEFMKAINQMQIQKIKADVQPKQCKSYSLRRKDITIRHVS